MSDKTQEIIQAAVQFENDGKSFYLETARKSANPLVREMFQSLARDEEKHIEWLRSKSAAEVDLAEEGQELYGKLKRIFSEAPEQVRAAPMVMCPSTSNPTAVEAPMVMVPPAWLPLLATVRSYVARFRLAP